jgi:flagellar hook-associated protein 3 FlgL
VSGPMTLRFTTQAQVDIRRMSRELTELQAKIASGREAKDLQGFGGASSRLLNAQSLRANADARASVINQLQARFGVQGAALGQVADAARLLAQSIREAISANDGRGVAIELDLSFASMVSALNETWNGQPLFAGERQGQGPIKVSTIDQMQAATTWDDIFDEAERHQVIDLGAGDPIVLSAKASELSQGLIATFDDLATLIDAAGGQIGQPISGAQRDALLAIVARLDSEAEKFTNEEGRAGQLQKRFDGELVRLQERSNLFVKEIGEQADADLAMVSIRLNTLLVQYEAAAKTFADLSQLSLLKYL